MINNDIEIKKLLDALNYSEISSEKIVEDLEIVLTRTVKRNKLIKALTVTDKGGLSMVQYSKIYPVSYLENIFSPSIGVILATSERAIDGTSISKINSVWVEGDKENIIVASITRNYLLGAIVDANAPRGLIIRDLRQTIGQLRGVLRKHDLK